jgi:transcriptional regulator with XRE-family HTH domain
MKPNQRERDNLERRIRAAHGKSSLSISEIARISGVNPGQASRILNGKFSTVSGSVLQICKILGVDPLDTKTRQIQTSSKSVQAAAGWAKLEASMLRAWDRTPQGADKLVKVIEAVAEATRNGAPPR